MQSVCDINDMKEKHTLKNAETVTAKDDIKFERIAAGEYVSGVYRIIKRDAKELGHEDYLLPRFEWFIYKGEEQGALDIVSTLRLARECVKRDAEISK
jgi:hypothetical protein